MNIPKKFVSGLGDAQVEQLEELVKNHSSARVRMRAHSILLSHRKVSIDEIARIYNVRRDTVSSWLDRWEKIGFKGLEDKPRSGAPRIISDADKRIIRNLNEQFPDSPSVVIRKFAEKRGKIISHSSLRRIINPRGNNRKIA